MMALSVIDSFRDNIPGDGVAWLYNDANAKRSVMSVFFIAVNDDNIKNLKPIAALQMVACPLSQG